MPLRSCSIGVSTHLGWAATSVIVVQRGELRILATDRIETASPGDREALEPYHVAGGFDGLEADSGDYRVSVEVASGGVQNIEVSVSESVYLGEIRIG